MRTKRPCDMERSLNSHDLSEGKIGDCTSVPASKRRNLNKDSVCILKQWLYDHRHNPYPTEQEKVSLSHATNLKVLQVCNWFINARRRTLLKMTKNAGQDAEQCLIKRKHKQSLLDGFDERIGKRQAEISTRQSDTCSSPAYIPCKVGRYEDVTSNANGRSLETDEYMSDSGVSSVSDNFSETKTYVDNKIHRQKIGWPDSLYVSPGESHCQQESGSQSGTQSVYSNRNSLAIQSPNAIDQPVVEDIFCPFLMLVNVAINELEKQKKSESNSS